MTSALNTASSGISSTIGLVGDVASSVVKASSGVAGKAIGEFGNLVNRMTTSSGNKPTPVENYVTMVTKQNAKNMTVA
jgi:hypothetical protein